MLRFFNFPKEPAPFGEGTADPHPIENPVEHLLDFFLQEGAVLGAHFLRCALEKEHARPVTHLQPPFAFGGDEAALPRGRAEAGNGLIERREAHRQKTSQVAKSGGLDLVAFARRDAPFFGGPGVAQIRIVELQFDVDLLAVAVTDT